MKILVVEDDQNLANGLILALKHEKHTVFHVSSGRKATNDIETIKPDLVLLDLGLPDLDGLSVIRKINTNNNQPFILVITARGSINDKINGLDLGADDYLSKPFEVMELLARIRALERRFNKTSIRELKIGPVILSTTSNLVKIDGREVDLTRREYFLLKTLMEGAGMVLSREQLESKIYKLDKHLTSNSIEVHIHNLRKKIYPEFIKTIRGIGYTVNNK